MIRDDEQIEGQLSLFDMAPELEPQPQTFEEYIGICKFCMWYGYGLYEPYGHKRRPGTEGQMCQWTEGKNPYCVNKSFWKPGEYAIPRLCSNCTWANQSCYQSKPEYKEDSLKAFHDPVEEPNIYCTHEDGSVNRRSPYKDFWENHFGCNTWDRQHEWDTCDAWASDGWKLEHSQHRNRAEGSTT